VERGHGQQEAAGTAEEKQGRSGTRKKKENKEMVTDRWGQAGGMTEKERITEKRTEMTEKRMGMTEERILLGEVLQR
jgi:hypothetical protein